MKTVRLWLLVIVMVSAPVANAKEWIAARVVDSSETNVTGEMRGEKHTLHYTIETESMVYFVDFTYKSGLRSDSGAPNISSSVVTKIAVEGKHLYILDVSGREVKLHIVKKTKK